MDSMEPVYSLDIAFHKEYSKYVPYTLMNSYMPLVWKEHSDRCDFRIFCSVLVQKTVEIRSCLLSLGFPRWCGWGVEKARRDLDAGSFQSDLRLHSFIPRLQKEVQELSAEGGLCCCIGGVGRMFGWVKSRFGGLLLHLEVIQGFCDPNPT
ncbi:uncharacterized protein LOC106767458 [Vigna radiata var. radiata]|uniref:Uncharacterized protein LOC106767458 n=1 Tax=Vigna radiata var. radiata TaxID=3916 RepID=A0A3Q0EYJ1_VIGRR|nr:uncharacterized protein LOC106767458 [Vigna radiata var. radiata]